MNHHPSPITHITSPRGPVGCPWRHLTEGGRLEGSCVRYERDLPIASSGHAWRSSLPLLQHALPRQVHCRPCAL